MKGQPLAATSRRHPTCGCCLLPALSPPPHPPCNPPRLTPPHPQAHFEVEGSDRQGQPSTSSFDFVPAEVLGAGAGYAPEPRWSSLPQMPYMEFYQGLRERNWTTKYYNPAAEKWSLQFFQDRCGGRGAMAKGWQEWQRTLAAVPAACGACLPHRLLLLMRLSGSSTAPQDQPSHPRRPFHTTNRTPARKHPPPCLQRPLHAPLL
jgi:hypothetical protein